MIDAAEVGDWQTVENMIRSGADVDSCFDREYLAIQVAVKNQHLDVVRVLLHNGANPYVIDSDGRFLIEVTEDWITEETIDDNGDVTYKTMRDPKQQEINRLILQTMIETDKESDNYPSDFLLIFWREFVMGLAASCQLAMGGGVPFFVGLLACWLAGLPRLSRSCSLVALFVPALSLVPCWLVLLVGGAGRWRWASLVPCPSILVGFVPEGLNPSGQLDCLRT